MQLNDWSTVMLPGSRTQAMMAAVSGHLQCRWTGAAAWQACADNAHADKLRRQRANLVLADHLPALFSLRLLHSNLFTC